MQASPGSKRRNTNLRTKWLKQVLVMWVCHTYAIGDLKSNENVNIANIARDYQKSCFRFKRFFEVIRSRLSKQAFSYPS